MQSSYKLDMSISGYTQNLNNMKHKTGSFENFSKIKWMPI
jgi:hypothetical protein